MRQGKAADGDHLLGLLGRASLRSSLPLIPTLRKWEERMLQTSSSNTGNYDWISSLTYKSMATSSPSPADLQGLVGQARARNRSLSVTGMLLYEKGSFFRLLKARQTRSMRFGLRSSRMSGTITSRC